MTLLKKLSTFSIIGITLILLMATVWNISRNNSALEGNDWLQAHELRSMTNDRSIPQLNNYTLNDVFNQNNLFNLIIYIQNRTSTTHIQQGNRFIVSMTADGYSYPGIEFWLPGDSVNDTLYINFDTKGDVSGLDIRFDDNFTTQRYSIQNANTWENVSEIHQEGSDTNFRLMSKFHSVSNGNFYFKDILILNLTHLEIEQTKDEMDSWYNLYLNNLKNDKPQAELNGYSLRQLFEDENELYQKTDFNAYQCSYIESNYEFTITTWGTRTSSQPAIWTDLSGVSGDKYYTRGDFKVLDSQIDFVGFRFNNASVPYTFVDTYVIDTWQSISADPTQSQSSFLRTLITSQLPISTWGQFQYKAKNLVAFNLTSLGIDQTKQEMDSWYDLYLQNQQPQEEQIYINYQDYNYIEQGQKTLNVFLTYWNVILDAYDFANFLLDPLFNNVYDTYDYYEYEELYKIWDSNEYYLDDPTQQNYSSVLYEKGLYYLINYDGGLETLRTVLDYEALDNMNDIYNWIRKD